jgi:GNAT superfamily N-acetyltransferase
VTVVRRAVPDDRAGVTRTVADAFRDDPGWGHIFGADYERLAGAFAGTLFDLRVGAGSVWVTDDLAAVALWEPPGGAGLPTGAVDAAWARYRRLAGPVAWARLQAYDDAVTRAHPVGRYWYLGVLATRPDHRGRGLATAVMAPALSSADRDGLHSCLETSTQDNRDFYQRRGFTEAVEVPLVGGPVTWWLTRRPRHPGPGPA